MNGRCAAGYGFTWAVIVLVSACGANDDVLKGGIASGAGGLVGAGGGTSRADGGIIVGAGSSASSGGENGGVGGGNGIPSAPGGATSCSGASCGTPHPGAAPPGAACTERNECASGRCEPKTGTDEVICLGACFADGAPCERALDCCSTGCHAGKCGGVCTVIGDSCAKDAECCSNICTGGRCEVDLANSDCRPTGEDCTSGNSRGCCHECDKSTKRCSFGDDTCFAQGVACTADGQCCHGICSAGVCTTPCSANGTACTSGVECCSTECSATGTCATKVPPPVGAGGTPGAGGAAGSGGTPVTVTPCVPTRERCLTSADCCSDQCFGGFCEAPIR